MPLGRVPEAGRCTTCARHGGSCVLLLRVISGLLTCLGFLDSFVFVCIRFDSFVFVFMDP